MKELVHELEKLGCTNIKTYIQSGNVVLQSPVGNPQSLGKRIGRAIRKSHGFEPFVLVLSRKSLLAAAVQNPYKNAESEPKSLHLLFLSTPASNPDLDALHRLKSNSESFKIIGDVFYLHAPGGIGRSKLASRAEKALGVSATGRNWRTVTKLIELAQNS